MDDCCNKKMEDVMKLYFAKGACSLAVRIIINEIGLACRYERVDLQSKKTENGEDFLKINVKGAVPVIRLDNGEVLTENSVILQYLADANNATGLLPKTDDFKRYRILEMLNYVATELHKTIGALFNPHLLNEAKDIYKTLIKNKCSFIDNHLSKQHYLSGDTFTLPDAYFFVMITWLLYFKFDLNEWKNIKRYYEELKERRSIVQSLSDEKLENSR